MSKGWKAPEPEPEQPLVASSGFTIPITTTRDSNGRVTVRFKGATFGQPQITWADVGQITRAVPKSDD